jgi:hypothetical protein
VALMTSQELADSLHKPTVESATRALATMVYAASVRPKQTLYFVHASTLHVAPQQAWTIASWHAQSMTAVHALAQNSALQAHANVSPRPLPN